MKRKNFFGVIITIFLIVIIPSVLSGQSMIPSGFKQIGFINFSNHQPGKWYTYDMMAGDWNPRLRIGDKTLAFEGIINHRAFIVKNDIFKGNALRVLLTKNKILYKESGAQIFSYIGGKEEIYYSASIFLSQDFECGKEIKMPPGIYGGWSWASGGKVPDGVSVGPSVRAIFQECQAKSYIYHLNQTGNNDDGNIYNYRNPHYGDKFAWKFSDSRPVIVTKGVKHEIMFYARMNTPGKQDGVHKVWYDGVLVLSLYNLEFRKVASLQFDTVGVEIFRGGGDQSYATDKDNTLDVSDFRIYVKD